MSDSVTTKVGFSPYEGVSILISTLSTSIAMNAYSDVDCEVPLALIRHRIEQDLKKRVRLLSPYLFLLSLDFVDNVSIGFDPVGELGYTQECFHAIRNSINGHRSIFELATDRSGFPELSYLVSSGIQAIDNRLCESLAYESWEMIFQSIRWVYALQKKRSILSLEEGETLFNECFVSPRLIS